MPKTTNKRTAKKKPARIIRSYGDMRTLQAIDRVPIMIVAVLCVALLVVLGYGVIRQIGSSKAEVVCSQTLDAVSGGSVQSFINGLKPGETGCLKGTFPEQGLSINVSGTAQQPITITSAPGQTASLRGRLLVRDKDPSGATLGYLTFSNLFLDGRNSSNLPSPTVLGDNITFTGNEVTNYNTNICFSLGSDPTAGNYGLAFNVVLEWNRIHNCGTLPATNQQHGIYVEATRNAIIRNNYIYDNADRGVQLFPNALGTLVENNIIDNNGQGIIFSSWHGIDPSTSNNVVRNNIITNSNGGSHPLSSYNVESYWFSDAIIGTNNIVTDNCLYNGKAGDIISPQVGFSASANTIADPLYTNRAAHDFTLLPNSPCSGKGPVQPTTTTSVTPPATATPPPPPSVTPPPPSSQPYSLTAEAESGLLSNASLMPDANGTNGSAVDFSRTGSNVVYPFSVPQDGTYTIAVRMRSQDYRGSAKADVYVDGSKVMSAATISASYSTYPFSKTLTAASGHSIKVVFLNDNWRSSTKDRNLWVDWFKIAGQ